jgi:hypothetical protein
MMFERLMSSFFRKGDPISDGDEPLPERIRRLNVARIAQSVVVRDCEKLADSSTSRTADLRDLRDIRDAASVARQLLHEIEAQLEAARAELHRQERIKERPALVARLAKIKSIVAVRDKDAIAAQRALEEFSDALHRLDRSTQELFAETRDQGARGIASFNGDFHPMNLAMRLRVPVALALRTTCYRTLVKQPLLTPSDDRIDFSEIEQRVGQKLVGQLERELVEIDALEKEIA